MAQSITISNAGDPGDSLSTIRIQRADGKFIDMPEESAIKEVGTKRRVNVRERLRKDGGVAIGDRTFDVRKYDLMWPNYATEDVESTYRSNHNLVEGFFRQDQEPIYLIQKDNNIRAEVVLTSHKINHPTGTRNRHSMNTMTFEMVDSLWESTDEAAFPGGAGSQTGGATTGGTGTGIDAGVGVPMSDEDTITVTNESQFDVYPRFYIIPQNNVVKFSLINQTLGGGFEFDSNDLISGTLLVLDSSEGTVELNGAEKSAGISQGGFIFLQPGENILKYESSGGSITIELVWRDRSAV